MKPAVDRKSDNYILRRTKHVLSFRTAQRTPMKVSVNNAFGVFCKEKTESL
jgi:hypothetical protein